MTADLGFRAPAKAIYGTGTTRARRLPKVIQDYVDCVEDCVDRCLDAGGHWFMCGVACGAACAGLGGDAV